ncbi:hypothetical protein [Chitinophaga jiangningensis]|uniref:hypothetical protein n=1 Tax=Chitinophaga jiangningensis TaxID=1419482 RepID=UPI001160B08C|nr:hypothetical protein [Chitinophaga jiangningensis]
MKSELKMYTPISSNEKVNNTHTTRQKRIQRTFVDAPYPRNPAFAAYCCQLYFWLILPRIARQGYNRLIHF